MSRRAGGLPELGREFSVERAREVGVSRGRLRGGDLGRPFRGVRVLDSGPPPIASGDRAPSGSGVESHAFLRATDADRLRDLAARCRAFATVMAPDAAFSHVTAALLHGMPVPRRLEVTRESLHVTGPRRASTAAGVLGHQATLDPIDVIDARDSPVGIRVTTPERTLCDLAPLLSLGELVAAADRALFHGDPLATRSSLAECVSRHRGRRGRPTLLRALALSTDLAESPPESLLRVLLIEAGLPAPTPQVRVQDAQGREIARVDLAYPEHRIAIEYEGDHHRTDRHQWRRDLARTRDLHFAAWVTLRTTPLDLAAPADMLLQLRHWLTTRAPDPAPAPAPAPDPPR
ncbi:hypothetical protein [Herbiconiux sp.]|uniref:hypothetical protein n=1 Tax=Herbiconiux sp. TaxID=1871186 RepID=UPI0025B7CB57|nr:hypothetical protein [Herbiconiux sp.]